MAENDRMNHNPSSQAHEGSNEGQTSTYQSADYLEETSAEFAAPSMFNRDHTEGKEEKQSGKGMGIAAIMISVLSLFMAPVFFGIVGIVLGFIARRRGAEKLGSWAIGIGALSIILGILIVPVI